MYESRRVSVCSEAFSAMPAINEVIFSAFSWSKVDVRGARTKEFGGCSMVGVRVAVSGQIESIASRGASENSFWTNGSAEFKPSGVGERYSDVVLVLALLVARVGRVIFLPLSLWPFYKIGYYRETSLT